MSSPSLLACSQLCSNFETKTLGRRKGSDSVPLFSSCQIKEMILLYEREPLSPLLLSQTVSAGEKRSKKVVRHRSSDWAGAAPGCAGLCGAARGEGKGRKDSESGGTIMC